MDKILLHCCCAPCSVSCIEPLREKSIEPVLFWYNPNIHPFKEYESRRNCMVEYAEKVNCQLILKEYYGLREFIRNISKNMSDRCFYCYSSRLEQTAKYAAENGFEAFSSTLLCSIYQNHEQIIQICEKAAQKYNINFFYYDFRQNFRNGNLTARNEGLYMQKYCGCIFSEEERYSKQILKAREQFNK